MRFVLLALSMFFSLSVSASSLQGLGMFEVLNKPWFMVGLHSERSQPGITSSIEIRIVEERITQQRFRQLWIDAFAISLSDEVWQRHAADFEHIVSLLHGPLLASDQIVLERQGRESVLSINLKEHARYSSELIDVIVTALTNRVVLSSTLRAGLLGQLSDKEARDLNRDFYRLIPSLSRIAETSRWLRVKSSQVNNLAGSPSV